LTLPEREAISRPSAVAPKFGWNWSPEQIAGWSKRVHPGDGSYLVSHETIYRGLFVQTRGVLKTELLQHLRSKRIGQKGEAQGAQRRLTV
jgi:IS30 family transposase